MQRKKEPKPFMLSWVSVLAFEPAARLYRGHLWLVGKAPNKITESSASLASILLHNR